MDMTRRELVLASLRHEAPERVPDLIDIGLDAWETVQTHLPGQESSHLKKLYGRHITFVGYICAPDHTIMSEVPAENVAALYETCAGFRKQGITG
mgnify:CR=1 FL=1|jgi:hypothetical protein